MHDLRLEISIQQRENHGEEKRGRVKKGKGKKMW